MQTKEITKPEKALEADGISNSKTLKDKTPEKARNWKSAIEFWLSLLEFLLLRVALTSMLVYEIVIFVWAKVK